MNEINSWWTRQPGERFWLGVTGHDGGSEMLAAPCAAAHPDAPARQQLIGWVRDGDVAFLFDDDQAAIVAWAVTRGGVRRRELAWRAGAGGQATRTGGAERLASWTVGLRRVVPLDRPVPVAEVARMQSDLFPALRALEDRVGDPIYYPFAMGGPQVARMLPGYVFKLPSLFVAGCPALARVAQQVGWFTLAQSSAATARTEGAGPQVASATLRAAPVAGHSTAAAAR